jgi:hypothetical protein
MGCQIQLDSGKTFFSVIFEETRTAFDASQLVLDLVDFDFLCPNNFSLN